MSRIWAGIALLAAILAAPPAFAHKLTLFAAQEGAVIAGRARYIPGGAAEGLTVEVRNANGEAIGEATTDADGRFTYAPQSEGEHIFVIATQDGHTAQARVTPGAQAAEPDGDAPESALDEEAIAAAVARQLAPIEADLAAWRAEERRRDRTAAGGMAAGLIGVALFAAARRRRLK